MSRMYAWIQTFRNKCRNQAKSNWTLTVRLNLSNAVILIGSQNRTKCYIQKKPSDFGTSNEYNWVAVIQYGRKEKNPWIES